MGGRGLKTLKDGDEVMMSLDVKTSDGTALEGSADFEYIIGSGGVGCARQGLRQDACWHEERGGGIIEVLKGLRGWRKVPRGRCRQFDLEGDCKVKDVSFRKDKTVNKRAAQGGRRL